MSDILKEISGEELRILYKQFEDKSNECYELAKPYLNGHTFKNPFSMCQYFIKEELGNRALLGGVKDD